jgi:hypothetical protein
MLLRKVLSVTFKCTSITFKLVRYESRTESAMKVWEL